MGRTEDALRRISCAAGVPDDGYTVATPETRGPRPLESYVAEPMRADRFAGDQPATRPSGDSPDTSDSGAGAEPATEAEKIIDVRQLAQYGGFVARAVARHKLIAALTLLLMFGATGAAVKLWPKTYHIQVTLLAQRNDLMASLSNPGRSIPPGADAPSRAAAQIIKRHDSLVALVKQTDLLNEWERTRAPLLRAKDRVFWFVFGRPSEDERLDSLVGLLERRIIVSVSDEGVIAIDIDWPDARVAYELASTCLQSFMDTRRASELTAINEAISILERSATSLQSDIDMTASQIRPVQPVRARLPRVRPAPLPGSPAVAAALGPSASPMVVQSVAGAAPETLFELARLKSDVDAKRQELARLEEAHRQQVAEAQSRLTAALTMYTEDHPSVTALRQTVTSLSRDSSELASARAEVQGLERQYDAAAKAAQEQQQRSETPTVTAGAEGSPAATGVVLPRATESETTTTVIPSPIGIGSEALDPTSLRLRLQLGQLANIRDRINAARIELAASQASFQYRYAIMRPPQVPRRPSKPNVLAVLLAGVVGAMLLAVGAAVTVDLLGGRLVELWQLERLTGVPVLARLHRL